MSNWTSYWARWARAHAQRHSGCAYRRRSHHQKKILTENETNRREWRESSGINLDKKKAGLGNSWSGQGCPKWLKRQCNKDYRKWIKHQIYREDYDALVAKTEKDFFDPWMWD